MTHWQGFNMTLETMIMIVLWAILLPILTIQTALAKMDHGWRGVVALWSFFIAVNSGILLIQYAVGAI